MLRALLAFVLLTAGVGGGAGTPPTEEVPEGAADVVVEEVAVSVPAVDDEGEVRPPEEAGGAADADLSVVADVVVADQVATTVIETEGFQLVGLTWPEDAAVDGLGAEVRTRSDGEWSEWVALEPADGGPDFGTADAESSVRGGAEPVWVGDADAVQARFAATSDGGPEGLEIALVDPSRPESAGESGPTLAESPDPGPSPTPHTSGSLPADPAGTASGGTPSLQVHAAGFVAPPSGPVTVSDIPAVVPAIATRPTIVTRDQWGADESLRTVNDGCGTPDYASTLVGAVIHHTATSNNYSTVDEAKAAIRSIQGYHVLSRGWCDIGYNFLVDKWGNVYEGRFGGVDQPVIGVHAGGFNTGTAGISMLGDYSAVTPSAATQESVARVVAWRLAAYDRDPTGTTSYYTYGGENSKIPANTTVTLPVVFPHRDVAYTACPGDVGVKILPQIRTRALEIIGPSDPFGQVDSISAAPGAVTASGWAIDPDTTGPVIVQLYVDGRENSMVWASLDRPDVGAVFPSAGPAHGYSISMPVTGGSHTACVYAVNVGAGRSVSLGCRSIVVPTGSPFGQVDSISVAPGAVTTSGWAIDPDTTGPIIVQMYVDGRANAMVWANLARPDVGAAFPWAGAGHGYTISMPVTRGVHSVCLYAVNTGPGSSILIGCRTITGL